MNKSGVLISPSILSADFLNLQSEVERVSLAGADWLHIDVMDGQFVPNLTIGIPVIAALKKKAQLPLDVHLMIEKPWKLVREFIEAGADYLTIHVESGSDQEILQTLQTVRGLGAKAGISLKPGTPLSRLAPFLAVVDLVLVMSVEPGFSGQKFMPEQMAKVQELKNWRGAQKFSYLIEVDGGVNLQTISQCQGAEVLVAGHAVFKSQNYSEAISALKMAFSADQK